MLCIAFVLASVVVLLIPGPTVLLVIAPALREGPRTTWPTVSGVVAGDALAVTMFLAGLGTVSAVSATLSTAMKWVGALYLIWLGIQGRSRPIRTPRGLRPQRRRWPVAPSS